MWNAVGVIVAFICIILLIRKHIPFGLAMILGSGIVAGFSLPQLLNDVTWGNVGMHLSNATFVLAESTIELAVLLTLVFMLAKTMQLTGAVQQLIESLRPYFSKGGILAVIPAIYGLMPVPGGALFSAPSIQEEGEKFQLKKSQKNFLNVWFRHIWFPVYPISSALILLSGPEFANVGIYKLIIANFPMFLGFLLIGYAMLWWFLHKKIIPQEKPEPRIRGLIYFLPPTVPLGVYAVLQFFGIPQYRAFIVGVALSLVLLYFLVDKQPRDYLDIIKQSVTWKLALAIFGIMLFRLLFEASQANMFFASVISHWSIPAVLIIVLIPLVLGLLTGYNLAAIALSYFIVEPFFALTSINQLGLVSLIFVGSLVGYLISPIHLCNVLSSEYLKTDTTRMYHYYIPAGFALLSIQLFGVFLFYST